MSLDAAVDEAVGEAVGEAGGAELWPHPVEAAPQAISRTHAGLVIT